MLGGSAWAAKTASDKDKATKEQKTNPQNSDTAFLKVTTFSLLAVGAGFVINSLTGGKLGKLFGGNRSI